MIKNVHIIMLVTTTMNIMMRIIMITILTLTGIVLKEPIRFAAVWGDGSGAGVLCGAQAPLDGCLAPWIN